MRFKNEERQGAFLHVTLAVQVIRKRWFLLKTYGLPDKFYVPGKILMLPTHLRAQGLVKENSLVIEFLMYSQTLQCPYKVVPDTG